LEENTYDFVVGCDGAGSPVRENLAPPAENANPNHRIEGKKIVLGSDYVLGAQVIQSME
jgi:2-polyprenyl-6-methoxyphenol hydroxylase-like FAD-dependent oxidoreductase